MRTGAEQRGFGNHQNGNAPQRVNVRMAASKSPSPGIKPKKDVLGKSVVVVE
jgi:hypothetical protein